MALEHKVGYNEALTDDDIGEACEKVLRGVKNFVDQIRVSFVHRSDGRLAAMMRMPPVDDNRRIPPRHVLAATYAKAVVKGAQASSSNGVRLSNVVGTEDATIDAGPVQSARRRWSRVSVDGAALRARSKSPGEWLGDAEPDDHRGTVDSDNDIGRHILVDASLVATPAGDDRRCTDYKSSWSTNTACRIHHSTFASVVGDVLSRQFECPC